MDPDGARESRVTTLFADDGRREGWIGLDWIGLE